MARRKRDAQPDEPAPNSPADLGWNPRSVLPPWMLPYRSGAPSSKRHEPVRVPDPGIRYGSFRVLQRTDGPFIVIDERLPPGEQTVDVIPIPTRIKPAEVEALTVAIASARARAPGEFFAGEDAGKLTAFDFARKVAAARCFHRAHPEEARPVLTAVPSDPSHDDEPA